VLDRAARDRLAPNLAYDPQQFSTYFEWETVRFGLGAVDVTRMILDEWRFPDEIVTAIENHLLFRPTSYEDVFACVLNLAGGIAVETGVALPGEQKLWAVTPEKFVGAGMSEGQWQSAAVDAREHFERQRAGL
jgi:hypothetical protein